MSVPCTRSKHFTWINSFYIHNNHCIDEETEAQSKCNNLPKMTQLVMWLRRDTRRLSEPEPSPLVTLLCIVPAPALQREVALDLARPQVNDGKLPLLSFHIT